MAASWGSWAASGASPRRPAALRARRLAKCLAIESKRVESIRFLLVL
jgi:hypothetical protein